jgi:hypothetical protein
METPRQGRADGPLCRIEVFEPWVAALHSLVQFERIGIGCICLGVISSCKACERRNLVRDILTEITSPAKPNRHGHR